MSPPCGLKLHRDDFHRGDVPTVKPVPSMWVKNCMCVLTVGHPREHTPSHTHTHPHTHTKKTFTFIFFNVCYMHSKGQGKIKIATNTAMSIETKSLYKVIAPGMYHTMSYSVKQLSLTVTCQSSDGQ